MFGCSNTDKSTKPDKPVVPLLKIEPSEDTLVFAERVMKHVVENADVGFMPNAFCDTFYKVPIEEFEPKEYMTLFAADKGVASCGLMSKLLVKILLQNGISAYTYDFGFSGTQYTHVLVLIKHAGQLLIFDPLFNYTLLDEGGKRIDFFRLLNQINGDSVSTVIKSDTLVSDMLIDKKTFVQLSVGMGNLLGCNELITSVDFKDNSFAKMPFNRCFNCNPYSECFDFITQFENKLVAETRFSNFHEGIALKINKVYGAADHQIINAEIDSTLRKISIETR